MRYMIKTEETRREEEEEEEEEDGYRLQCYG